MKQTNLADNANKRSKNLLKNSNFFILQGYILIFFLYVSAVLGRDFFFIFMYMDFLKESVKERLRQKNLKM